MLVGLAGYASSGKDAAAQCLVHRGWRQDAFAATLKEMALDSDPCIYLRTNELWSLNGLVSGLGWDEAKKHQDVRRYLQNLGTATRKHLGGDVWIRALHQRCLGAGWPPTVVTDVRFPNEAHWLLETGRTGSSLSPGTPLKHRPPALIWISRPGVGPVNDHPSDQGLVRPLCTHEIDNNGTPEELWRKVLEVVGC